MALVLRIVWDAHANIVIRDIDIKWKSRISQYMFENRLLPNPILAHLGFQDEPDIEMNYSKVAMHILDNESSIVAINENTMEIYAVALLKCMTEEWFAWKSLSLQARGKMRDLTDLNMNLVKQYHAKNPDSHFDSLHMFDFHIGEEFADNDEFIQKFFNCIWEVARHMKMPRVTYVSMIPARYEMANAVQFYELEGATAYYVQYQDRNGRLPFVQLHGSGERCCWLHERLVEPLLPYSEMPIHEPVLTPSLEILQIRTLRKTTTETTVEPHHEEED